MTIGRASMGAPSERALLHPEPKRYPVLTQPAMLTADQAELSPTEDDRVRLLRAVAQGLADDAADRTMSTNALKESLEREVGSIAWPEPGRNALATTWSTFSASSRATTGRPPNAGRRAS